MRARSTCRRLSRPSWLDAIVAVSLGGALTSAGAAHADAVAGLAATISASVSEAAAGGTVDVTATFTPSTDVGPISVAIDVLGGDADTSVAVSAASAELTGCNAAGSTVTCAWDAQTADGPQTLTATVILGPAAAAGSLTMRALGAMSGTAATSVAETQMTVAAIPSAPATLPPETTASVETTTTTVEETTTTEPPPPSSLGVVLPTVTAVVPIEQAPATAPATQRTTAQAPVSTRDDLPTTGTDSDRSLRLAIAVMVGGVGLVMLARRERPAQRR